VSGIILNVIQTQQGPRSVFSMAFTVKIGLSNMNQDTTTLIDIIFLGADMSIQ